MRGFLVDTNVLSEFAEKGEPDLRVKVGLESHRFRFNLIEDTGAFAALFSWRE
jgi:hypothetical protein